MVVIYLFYIRDQILRIFFNVETVSEADWDRSDDVHWGVFQIVCTHNHGDTDGIVSLPSDSHLHESPCTLICNRRNSIIAPNLNHQRERRLIMIVIMLSLRYRNLPWRSDETLTTIAVSHGNKRPQTSISNMFVDSINQLLLLVAREASWDDFLLRSLFTRNSSNGVSSRTVSTRPTRSDWWRIWKWWKQQGGWFSSEICCTTSSMV